MSQHHLTSGQEQITTGYDRPLNHFHLTGKNARGEVTYTQLSEPRGGLTLNDLTKKCRELKLNVPEELFEHLEDEQRTGATQFSATWQGKEIVHVQAIC